MRFIEIERIKQLRERYQLPLRKITAALDIDSVTYWKIKRGDRQAKREQFAGTLQADSEELLVFWLADQVIAVVEDDKEISDKVLDIVKQKINKQKI